MPKPLAGLLVVSLDQAVAAPMTARRLADAGARVIKLERPDGDFARGYDRVAGGLSSYFVWLNRGKESVIVDLAIEDDQALFRALLAKADVLVQNLKPGALAKLGFAIPDLQRAYPRLITCSISGYGEGGPYARRKAYDLLIQAESGLASVTGSPDAPSRIGVSVVDIATGHNAYEAILEALLVRATSGKGSAIDVSMFDSMAEWMAVPLLHGRAGKPPKRIGLAHPSLAPYGVFTTKDDVPILISIQNDREWVVLARDVMGNAALAVDHRLSTNTGRVAHRDDVDGAVAAWFSSLDCNRAIAALNAGDIAFGLVNDVDGLAHHPHLREVTVGTENGAVSLPAPPARWEGAVTGHAGDVPKLGAHTSAVRREFLGG